ncbi:MAG: Thivi_2564 family membrane protein [Microvirga sp.]
MLSFLLLLIILGVVLYLVETYIPMSPPFKVVIRVVVILLLVVALLRLIGYPVGNFRL